MMDTLNVLKREAQETGSRACRKLRRAGRVPAVLYGHGQENEKLAVPLQDVKLVLRHRGKMVQLQGDVEETALLTDVQWDPLGINILHLDLIRVDLKEKVEVSIRIQTHGDPVGAREGGMFLQDMHQVDIRCPAGSIPEEVGLDIAEIHVGEFRTVADLELPDGAELVTSPDSVVAHVEKARAPLEEEELEAGAEEVGAEPEVIGGSKEKTEEES